MRGLMRGGGRVFKVDDANLQRMLGGNAPIDINGDFTELHHRDQQANYRVDEYTKRDHQKLPHDKDRDSGIDRLDFAEQRGRYWVTRALEILGTK
jgi:hypothetical protein